METTLSTAQKRFVDMMVDDFVYTNEALATACEVDVRTIYRWKRNPDITAAINKVADASFGQYINQANRTVLEVMENGTESGKLKAVEMLFKALGKFKDVSEVTVTETKTIEERKATLLQRLKG